MHVLQQQLQIQIDSYEKELRTLNHEDHLQYEDYLHGVLNGLQLALDFIRNRAVDYQQDRKRAYDYIKKRKTTDKKCALRAYCTEKKCNCQNSRSSAG